MLPLRWSIGYENLTIREIVSIFSFQHYLRGLGHLWFIEYILFCYLLIPCLDTFKQSFLGLSVRSTLLYLIVAALCYVAFAQISRLHFNPAWILCFLTGYWLAFIKEIKGNNVFKIISYALIVFGLICFFMRVYGDVCLLWKAGRISAYYNIVRPYLIANIGIAIFLMFYHLANPRELKVLKLSDKYSYEVYLVHHIFILGPMSILVNGGGGKWPLLLVCIIGSTIVLHKLANAIISLINRALKL